jgi:hypothetical protein
MLNKKHAASIDSKRIEEILDEEHRKKGATLLDDYEESNNPEFKKALKKLVNNESLVKMEQGIEERRKRLLTSRGWARASGVK